MRIIGLPPTTAGPELVVETRNQDVAIAIERRVSVIRADVAGHTEHLVSYGSSGIVDSRGVVLRSAPQLVSELIVADIEVIVPTASRERFDPFTVATDDRVLEGD